MLITAAQCRAARALIDWKQPDLARASGLGLSTIVDFEKARRAVSDDAIRTIRSALEAAGIQFLDQGETAVGAGVALSAKLR